jgi:hypothetical protein
MREELNKIYEDTIPHSTFLDKISVEKCMENSYNLGVRDVLKWLSKMEHLSSNIDYIIDEWNNQNNER